MGEEGPAPEDGYGCYEISDERGVTLRFSFHLFERSVQTVLSVTWSSLRTSTIGVLIAGRRGARPRLAFGGEFE